VVTASADAAPLPPADSSAPTEVVAVHHDVEPSSGKTSALRPVAWVAGGVGLGSLAFGIVETVVMVQKQNAFNDHTVASPTLTDPNRRVPDCTTAGLVGDCGQLRNDYTRAKTFAIVGYVAGGLLAATSAVLFTLSRSSAPQTVGMSGGCAPTLDAPGVSCLLRF
jgi:hypothetical protein